MTLIHNIAFAEQISADGVFKPKAFKCLKDDSGLSFIEQDSSLASEDALERLQLDSKMERSGDLPGFGFIKAEQLAAISMTTKPFKDARCARPNLHREMKDPTCSCEDHKPCKGSCGCSDDRSIIVDLAGFATNNNKGKRLWRVIKGGDPPQSTPEQPQLAM